MPGRASDPDRHRATRIDDSPVLMRRVLIGLAILWAITWCLMNGAPDAVFHLMAGAGIASLMRGGIV